MYSFLGILLETLLAILEFLYRRSRIIAMAVLTDICNKVARTSALTMPNPVYDSPRDCP